MKRKWKRFLAVYMALLMSVSFILPSNAGVMQASAATTAKSRVSVHDPSIVKDGDTYYIFGSHRAWAKSTDLMNWTMFTNNINTDYATMFQDIWNSWCKTDTNPDVAGNLWAPDVIYNTAMGKWCMYMSVNGSDYNSAIVLLTADSIEGPYTYQGEVVYSGFNTTTHPAASTDVYTVLGEDADLTRYQSTADTKLNAIDPCVKYDKDGNLWMSFGSWFGGRYILKLDNTTGLRDYSYSYHTVTNVSDAYFGYKLAGGYGVSGEGSYIIYDAATDYYYMFESYAGFEANGGYNMRLYRSHNIYGPYTDENGNSSIRTSYTDIDPYGVKLIGNYSFDCLSRGYKAAGHNSALVDDDGTMYLVYHTRFDSGTSEHQVRVHQMIMNQDGWPVVAPYEYNGDAISTTGYTAEDIVGDYEYINHGTASNGVMLDTQYIRLNADNTISGDITGTWSMEAGTSNMTAVIGNITYQGVFLRQGDESSENKEVMTFTATGGNQCIWGSKLSYTDEEAVVKSAQLISESFVAKTKVDLTLPTSGYFGTTISWSSDQPEILSTEGVVNRQTNDTVVSLTATITKNDATYTLPLTVTVTGIVVTPVYQYAFNDTAAGTVLTRSGDNTDGTNSGTMPLANTSKAAAFVEGVHDKALYLDGTYGMALNTEAVGNSYSIAFWVKSESLSTFTPIVLIGSDLLGTSSSSKWLSITKTPWGTDGSEISPVVWSRNQVTNAWPWYQTADFQAAAAGTLLTDNEWNYVVVTVDGSQPSATAYCSVSSLYINGSLVGTGSVANDVFSGNARVYLGINCWDKNFTGAFDDIKIYDQALSLTEITAAMNETAVDEVIDNGVSDPVYQYNFEGEAGGDVLTRSGDNDNGTNTGTLPTTVPEASAQYGEGVTGQALYLDGSYGVALDAASVGETYSLSFWVKPESLANYGPILNIGSDLLGDSATWLNITQTTWGANSSTISPVIWSRNTTANSWPWFASTTGTTQLALDTWTHITLTVDGNTTGSASGTVAGQLYINGVLTGSGDIAKDSFNEASVIYLGINCWDQNFKGYFDDIKIYNKVLSTSEVETAMNGPSPIYETGFEASLKGTVVTRSGANTLPAADFTIEPQYEEGVTGKALYLDGSYGVKLDTAAAGESYSLAFWVKADSLTDYGPIINLGSDLLSTNTSAKWMNITKTSWVGDTSPVIWSRNETNGAWPWFSAAAGGMKLPLNEWKYIVVTVDGNTIGSAGGTVSGKLYIDGVLAGTGDVAKDTFTDGSSVYLGINCWDSNFEGYFDDIKIYGKVLTADEVVNAMNTAVVDQTEAVTSSDPIYQYNFEEKSGGTIVSRAGDKEDGTNTGTLPTAASELSAKYDEGVYGQALYLDGSYGVALDAKSVGDTYSLSFWVKPESLINYGPILNMGSDLLGDSATWLNITQTTWGADGSTISPVIWSRNAKANSWPWFTSATDTKQLSLNTWTHITVTVDGDKAGSAAGTVAGQLYINGVLSGSGDIARDTFNEASVIYLGINCWDQNFKGYFDDIKIYNKVLSASEVKTAMEGPSTIYENGFDGALSGTIVTRTASNTLPSAASEVEPLYAEGVNDKALNLDGSYGVKLDTAAAGENYTLAFWVKADSLTDFMPILDLGSDFLSENQSAQWLSITKSSWIGDLSPIIWSRNETLNVFPWFSTTAGGMQLPLNEWKHIAVTVDGSKNGSTAGTVVGKLYINGTLAGAGDVAKDTFTGDAEVYLGINCWDSNFTGSVDDIKIYDKVLTAEEIVNAMNTAAKSPALPTATPTATPTVTPTTAPTAAPTAAPVSPVPTLTPTVTPTPKPTAAPTPVVEALPGNGTQAAVEIATTIHGDTMKVSVEVKTPGTAGSEQSPVQIPVSSQNVVNQISNPEVKKVDIALTLPADITNSNTHITMDPALLQAAASEKKDISVTVNDEAGKELYSWTFGGTDLANSSQTITSVDLSLSVERAADNTSLNELLSSSDTQTAANALVINFNHEGTLPAQAEVRIYVGNLVPDASGKVYVYHYNPETKKLETLPYSSGYQIDSEGYITVKLLHCSDYVVLPKPASSAVMTSLINQISIAAGTGTLYYGGTRNYSTKLTLTLPPTLELVASLEDKTSSSAIGAVVVSYESSNKKVATVSSDGTITATGTGKATIRTTVTLYSGKTKTFTTKVNVKQPSIKFTRSTGAMKVGESFTFEIKAYGLDASLAVWTTTKKSVVVINKNGKATAKSKGTDYVKVQIGGVTKTIKVVVK